MAAAPAVVLVFAHQPALAWHEAISFAQCVRVLGAHPLRLVCPAGLDVSAYRAIAPDIVVDFIPPRWLASYRAYNRLKILPGLYRRYSAYEYILTCELDAFVFRDDLAAWCAEGWDFVGAPTFAGYLDARPDNAPMPLLNSGFSLRRTRSMLRVSRTLRYIERPADVFAAWRAAGRPSLGSLLLALSQLAFHNNFFAPFNDFGGNEDDFWCLRAARRFPWFRLAPYEVARRFAFEMNAPRLLAENSGCLPFGCHKWATLTPDFWRPFVESFGHTLPTTAPNSQLWALSSQLLLPIPSLAQLRFYPTSLALRFKLAMTRSLLRSRFHWQALDRLGIPGHGLELIRLDFPPAADLPPRWGHGRPLHPELAALIDANREEQLAWLRACLCTAVDCCGWPAAENPADPALPWRDNEFLRPADQVVLHGLLHHVRPELYLEVGSGMSTRVAWQARRAGTFPMEIVSVDPEPRLAVSDLCDRVHRRPLEEIADEFLRLVTPRTVVFFDGSHRSFPGSDVTVFFLEILPRLPAGTLVHIHDIHLPADYPTDLGPRFWSEQYLLAGYLLGGARRLKIILPCAHLATTEPARSLFTDAIGIAPTGGSSFWLQIV